MSREMIELCLWVVFGGFAGACFLFLVVIHLPYGPHSIRRTFTAKER